MAINLSRKACNAPAAINFIAVMLPEISRKNYGKRRVGFLFSI